MFQKGTILIDQRSIILNDAIRKYGCLLLCYVELAQRITNQKYNDHTAVVLYHHFVERGYIKDDCTVLKPDMIMQSLGVNLNGWIRRESKSYEVKRSEYEIQEWSNARTGNTHFVLPDYDPLVDSVTVKEGKISSKIIVRCME